MPLKCFPLLVFLSFTAAIPSFSQVNPIGSINQSAVESRSGGYINIGPKGDVFCDKNPEDVPKGMAT